MRVCYTAHIGLSRNLDLDLGLDLGFLELANPVLLTTVNAGKNAAL